MSWCRTMRPPSTRSASVASRVATRGAFLLPAVAVLVCSILGGLRRAGLGAVPAPAAAVVWHGPLLVVGFLGTLIGLERAAASGGRPGYAAPLATAAAGLGVLAGGPPELLGVAGALAGVILLARFASAFRRVRSEALLVQGLGALAFGWGSARFGLTGSVAAALPGWLGFFALTIAGERLELARFRVPPPAARRALRLVVGVLLLGVFLPVAFAGGGRLLGAGFLLLAAWLARYDLASRSLRRPGLPRFMAVALLAGYAWLAVAGSVVLGPGLGTAGPRYDAGLHAFTLGFVFSMVFAHGPVILPGLLGLRCAFTPRFYAHLALLHAGLLGRLAGDALGLHGLRGAGAAVDAAAIALFFLQTATALRAPPGSGGAPVGAPAAG